MPAENRKRIAAFSTKIFGWKTKMLGPDMNDYVLVNTTEVDKKSRPKKPGAINGGFVKTRAPTTPLVADRLFGYADPRTLVRRGGSAVFLTMLFCVRGTVDIAKFSLCSMAHRSVRGMFVRCRNA